MKFNFSTLKSLITSVIFIALFSCDNDPLKIDVSDVQIDLKINHFDQDLFDKKGDLTLEKVNELQNDYGIFFEDFTTRIIEVGNIESPEAQYHLNAFTNDVYITEIKAKSDGLYSDFSSYKSELENAFKHYRHYFPKKKIPQIITFISGYHYSILTDKNYLGIGLDMFLGSMHEDYSRLGLPQYKTSFMNKDNLVKDAVLGWVSTEFVAPDDNADLLTEMVYQGKNLYATEALMPNSTKNLVIDYTPEQLIWCKSNAQQIWFYIIDNELLYTKKTSHIIKFMGESPFIQGFPEGSPGRVGHWIGWQIVKAYMEKNPTVTLEQLMNETNAQKILTQSKYKP